MSLKLDSQHFLPVQRTRVINSLERRLAGSLIAATERTINWLKIPTMDELKQLKDKLEKEFSELPEQYGYIVYCYDRGTDGSGVGFSKNADVGDAIVAIARIAEVFGIDLYTLAVSLKE